MKFQLSIACILALAMQHTQGINGTESIVAIGATSASDPEVTDMESTPSLGTVNPRSTAFVFGLSLVPGLYLLKDKIYKPMTYMFNRAVGQRSNKLSQPTVPNPKVEEQTIQIAQSHELVSKAEDRDVRQEQPVNSLSMIIPVGDIPPLCIESELAHECNLCASLESELEELKFDYTKIWNDRNKLLEGRDHLKALIWDLEKERDELKANVKSIRVWWNVASANLNTLQTLPKEITRLEKKLYSVISASDGSDGDSATMVAQDAQANYKQILDRLHVIMRKYNDIANAMDSIDHTDRENGPVGRKASYESWDRSELHHTLVELLNRITLQRQRIAAKSGLESMQLCNELEDMGADLQSLMQGLSGFWSVLMLRLEQLEEMKMHRIVSLEKPEKVSEFFEKTERERQQRKAELREPSSASSRISYKNHLFLSSLPAQSASDSEEDRPLYHRHPATSTAEARPRTSMPAQSASESDEERTTYRRRPATSLAEARLRTSTTNGRQRSSSSPSYAADENTQQKFPIYDLPRHQAIPRTRQRSQTNPIADNGISQKQGPGHDSIKFLHRRGGSDPAKYQSAADSTPGNTHDHSNLDKPTKRSKFSEWKEKTFAKDVRDSNVTPRKRDDDSEATKNFVPSSPELSNDRAAEYNHSSLSGRLRQEPSKIGRPRSQTVAAGPSDENTRPIKKSSTANVATQSNGTSRLRRATSISGLQERREWKDDTRDAEEPFAIKNAETHRRSHDRSQSSLESRTYDAAEVRTDSRPITSPTKLFAYRHHPEALRKTDLVTAEEKQKSFETVNVRQVASAKEAAALASALTSSPPVINPMASSPPMVNTIPSSPPVINTMPSSPSVINTMPSSPPVIKDPDATPRQGPITGDVWDENDEAFSDIDLRSISF